jgi:hypothetical protein
MPDADCSAKGIPERLHRDNRLTIQSFSDKEKLWMRFDPSHKLVEGKPSPGILRSNKQSVNREFPEAQPPTHMEDVLYNINGPPHHLDSGILEFKVSHVNTLQKEHPTEPEKVFTFQIIHDPERCMYPHCEIRAYLNGSELDEIRPSRIKTWLREQISVAWQTTRQPNATQ